ncbi:MAG: hypothetical protein IJG15_01525, partial [Lachnospiraceae bacterium]|nr:hypothetical protein [Lachnospiraceae bacterium]
CLHLLARQCLVTPQRLDAVLVLHHFFHTSFFILSDYAARQSGTAMRSQVIGPSRGTSTGVKKALSSVFITLPTTPEHASAKASTTRNS